MRHVLVALLALGCGGSASVTTPTPVDVSPTLVVAPEHAVEVHEVALDAPGEGPAQVLRFRPAVGQRQTLRTVMEIGVAISVGDATPQESAAPPVAFDTETHVTEVAADGTFRVESRIVALNVGGDPDDPGVRAYRAQLAPLTRLTGWTVVDPRGRVLGLELTVPDDLAPEMAQTVEGVRDAMRQLLPPLPEEPVAPGAQWHWEAPVTANGVTFTQHTSYTLRERDGDAFALDVRVTQSAQPQPLASPTPSMTMELLEMRSRGTGTSGLHHDARLVGSTIGVETELRARTTQGESHLDVLTQLRVVTTTTQL